MFQFGSGQCLLVHLLILVERNLVYLHRHCGHHIRRFPLLDEGIETLNIHLLIANDIGADELTATRGIKGLNCGILYLRIFAYDSLHLGEFDAEPANLHLGILATHKLDVAIGQPAHDVACVIYALISLIV